MRMGFGEGSVPDFGKAGIYAMTKTDGPVSASLSAVNPKSKIGSAGEGLKSTIKGRVSPQLKDGNLAVILLVFPWIHDAAGIDKTHIVNSSSIISAETLLTILFGGTGCWKDVKMASNPIHGDGSAGGAAEDILFQRVAAITVPGIESPFFASSKTRAQVAALDKQTKKVLAEFESNGGAVPGVDIECPSFAVSGAMMLKVVLASKTDGKGNPVTLREVHAQVSALAGRGEGGRRGGSEDADLRLAHEERERATTLEEIRIADAKIAAAEAYCKRIHIDKVNGGISGGKESHRLYKTMKVVGNILQNV
jgi:hypothetical protein